MVTRTMRVLFMFVFNAWRTIDWREFEVADLGRCHNKTASESLLIKLSLES